MEEELTFLVVLGCLSLMFLTWTIFFYPKEERCPECGSYDLIARAFYGSRNIETSCNECGWIYLSKRS